MPFLIVLIAVVALVWGAIFVQRGSLIEGCLAFLIVGYTMGFEFLHFDLGPLPLTLERLLLVGLVGCYLVHRRMGRLKAKPLVGADWLLLALVALLSASTLLADGGLDLAGGGSPVWRLVAAFWMPLVLYWMGRQVRLSERSLGVVMGTLALFGLYLALTAVAEITQQWQFVFPKYIANPDLGIHFGRARGATLASQTLGLYLSVCLVCAWLFRPRLSRPLQLALICCYPLLGVAIYFTYTRAAWFAAAAGLFVVLALQLSGAWRRLLLLFTVAAGLLVVPLAWNHVMGFQRETSASQTRNSVHQRASFAYVSWQMFLDRPLFGYGYGRFYDAKMDYLNDRSTGLNLESIRGLQHHNTFLSMLTETGLVGLVLFLAVLAAWARHAWALYRSAHASEWVRTTGVLMLGVGAAYVATALFHDLSLSPQCHWLVFFLAGINIGVRPAAAALEPVAKTQPQLTTAGCPVPAGA